ncbi:MAG TPA: extracellular solute-binding protein [Candidatus Binatia bacterium]
MESIRHWRLLSIVLCFCVFGFMDLARSQSVFGQTTGPWKEKWDKTVAAAKKEGKVVVFGPPGDLVRRAVTEGFQRAFPDISMEYSAARSGVQAAKVKAERQAGIFSLDVVLQGTTTAAVFFKPMGALAPVKPLLILPEVTDTKNWRGKQLEFSDKDQHNLVFGINVKVPVAYNLDQVKQQDVDELEDLLNPKWKGKIVVSDPLTPGAANVTFRFIWRALGPEKAKEFFRKIREQAGIVDRDERRMTEWVAQGRYAILLGPSDRIIAELSQRGLKFGVQPDFKRHGSLTTPGPSSIIYVDRAPHPNAAAVFINWILGKEGQTAWSKATQYASHRTDVPTEHLPSYVLPKAGTKYWRSYLETDVRRSPEEEAVLKEVFGR